MNLEEAKAKYEAERAYDATNKYHWDDLSPRIQQQYLKVYNLGPIDTREKATELMQVALDEMQIIQGHLDKAFPK